MSKAAIIVVLIAGICPVFAGSPQMRIQQFHPLAPTKPARQAIHPPAARLTPHNSTSQGLTRAPKAFKGKTGKASGGKKSGR